MAHPLWLASPFLFLPVPPCLFLLPPPLRTVLWARQPDRHGKPVLLRQQGEWRRLRRLHLPHKKSGIQWKRKAHKEIGITSRKRCCWNLQKADVQFSVQQLHFPGASSKAKDTENCLYILLRIKKQLRLFRIIVFANQLSLYGAVANMCEEFESLQDRSGQPDVLMGQSIVLSEIKAEVPLEHNLPSHHHILLQRYEKRIEMLSRENKVSKFCMDAGFIHVVEIGQYFMTKDTGEQFFARACRECTLPTSDESSQPKGWIQGNTRIGPVLEITTSCLYGKHGIEIRIWSLSEDNTQSWVRISHRSNNFVIHSNHNNTEVPADLPEEQASQLKMKDFAARSKAKAKPQRRELVDLSSIIPMNERKWIEILNQEIILSLHTMSRRKWSIFFDTLKQYNEKTTEQFNSGE